MEVQEAYSSAPLTAIHDSKTPQKKNSAPVFSKSPKRKNKFSADRAVLTSNVRLPTLKPLSKTDLQREDSLTPQLSTESFFSKLN